MDFDMSFHLSAPLLLLLLLPTTFLLHWLLYARNNQEQDDSKQDWLGAEGSFAQLKTPSKASVALLIIST